MTILTNDQKDEWLYTMISTMKIYQERTIILGPSKLFQEKGLIFQVKAGRVFRSQPISKRPSHNQKAATNTMSEADHQLHKDEDPQQVSTEPQLPSLPGVVDDNSVVSGDHTASTGSTVYKYRDFSNVNEDDEDAVGTPDGGPVPAPSRNTMETSIRVQKFPVKLYATLA